MFCLYLFLLVSEKPVNNHKLVYSVAFVFFNAMQIYVIVFKQTALFSRFSHYKLR